MFPNTSSPLKKNILNISDVPARVNNKIIGTNIKIFVIIIVLFKNVYFLDERNLMKYLNILKFLIVIVKKKKFSEFYILKINDLIRVDIFHIKFHQ